MRIIPRPVLVCKTAGVCIVSVGHEIAEMAAISAVPAR
jgi:hypothetical protein